MSTPLRPGPLERLRVTVAVGHEPGVPAHDVFLLEAALPTAPTDLDTDAYLDLLEPLLASGATTVRRWAVEVLRRHASWSDAGEVEVRLDLWPGREWLPDARVEAAREVFRAVLDLAGSPEAEELGHDAAVARARDVAERAYPEVVAGELSLREEEHVPATGVQWVGFDDAGAAHLEVWIGFVDGLPTTARVRRVHAFEVVDSVGT